MKYKIVADSSANIYEKAGTPFTSVPLKIVTSEKEYVDQKGTDIAEMVAYLQSHKGRSSTSCPNIHEWLEAFGDADIVVGVAITSGLSGSYTAAAQAKTDYETAHPDARVFILDSLSAGPELKLIVEKIEELTAKELPYEDLVQAIKDYHRHSHLLFSLERLDNLARNGRVSPAVAKLAGILGIRIVGKASDEGTLETLHKCRGESRTVSTIWAEMQKHGYRGGKVRLDHCFNPGIAHSLANMIHQKYPKADVRIDVCTALCSYYAEEGGLMIGYEDL